MLLARPGVEVVVEYLMLMSQPPSLHEGMMNLQLPMKALMVEELQIIPVPVAVQETLLGNRPRLTVWVLVEVAYSASAVDRNLQDSPASRA